MKKANLLTTIVAAGALAVSGLQTNAQTTLTSETAAHANKQELVVPMQRLALDQEHFSFKHDHYFLLGDANPGDVTSLFLNKKLGNDYSITAGMLNVGNWDGDDEQFFAGSITKKNETNAITLEAGKSARQTGPSREWAVVYFRGEHISGDVGFFSQGSTFDKDVEKYKYAWIGAHNKHLYASVGNEIDRTWATSGVHGFDDFGMFTFGKHDRQTGDVWIRSQAAIGDVNKSFFNNDLFNFATSYFVVPAFHTIKFSPVSDKGDLALKLDYKKNGVSGEQETELMLGTNRTPVQIGLGVNTSYQKDTTKTNVVVELYKQFVINDKLKGSLEARYNARTNDASAYAKLQYELGGN